MGIFQFFSILNVFFNISFTFRDDYYELKLIGVHHQQEAKLYAGSQFLQDWYLLSTLHLHYSTLPYVTKMLRSRMQLNNLGTGINKMNPSQLNEMVKNFITSNSLSAQLMISLQCFMFSILNTNFSCLSSFRVSVVNLPITPSLNLRND